jgi:hypothetical protein
VEEIAREEEEMDMEDLDKLRDIDVMVSSLE